MNAKISVLVICVEAIIYLLLGNFNDFTFNSMFDVLKEVTFSKKITDFKNLKCKIL